MMDKSFEKQIADKLNRMEVQPSDGLLDSIFEKRAARPKRFAGIGFSGLALAVLLVSAGVASWLFWDNSGTQTKQQAIGENNLPQSLAEARKPADVQPAADGEVLAGQKDKNQKAYAGSGNSRAAAENKSGQIAGTRVKRQVSASAVAVQAPVSQSNAINPQQYFDLSASGRPFISPRR